MTWWHSKKSDGGMVAQIGQEVACQDTEMLTHGMVAP